MGYLSDVGDFYKKLLGGGSDSYLGQLLGLGGEEWEGLAGPDVTDSAQSIIFQNLLMPQMQQMWYLSSSLGMNPQDFFGQFMLTGKGAADALKNNPLGTLAISGNTAFDLGSAIQKMPTLLDQYQTQYQKQSEAALKKLEGSPLYGEIAAGAQGQFSSKLTGMVDTAYANIGGAIIGKGTTSGFIADENKQASLLGPLALQKAQYLQGMQDKYLSMALQLTGGGGLGGAAPGAFSSNAPATSFLSPTASGIQQFLQSKQYQGDLSYDVWNAQNQQSGDLLGSIIGLIGLLA